LVKWSEQGVLFAYSHYANYSEKTGEKKNFFQAMESRNENASKRTVDVLQRPGNQLMWWLIYLLMGLAVWYLVSRLKLLWKKPYYTATCRLEDFPFKTGDLILTSDQTLSKTASCTGAIIKIFSSSAYHHVAIVYVDPRTNQIFFWEINGNGTRLSSMYDMTCKKPNHFVAVRSINKPVDNEIFESVLRKQWNYYCNMDICMSWYHRFLQGPYLPIPMLRGHTWGKNDQKTCVHMALELYRALGVVDFTSSGTDPSIVFPADFAKEKLDPRYIPLTNGYDFGPITLLEFQHQETNLLGVNKTIFRRTPKKEDIGEANENATGKMRDLTIRRR
jgi:hypothetical protein